MQGRGAGAVQSDDPVAFGQRYRALPSVASLLAEPDLRRIGGLDDDHLTRFLQVALAEERAEIGAGGVRSRAEIVSSIRARLASLARPRLAPLLNATGIIIHTNLGRAPVSPETAAAMAEAAANPVSLELDPETNRRGGRMDEIAGLVRVLTGAEATLVVNNNAAAIFLVLSAVAAGRSVVLSRGEAVEIGGGFRIPDLLRQSGATLVEVGTTNRTYPRDYEDVIGDETAALLKVHPSNFAVTGFTRETSVAELAEVGRRHGVPVIDDQGSGALLDAARFGLGHEATIGESLAAGATLVTASGDKLLGGPQAGLIVGDAAWVERVARHPLARAVRADKTCLAGLAATLRHYAGGEAVERVPVWRMIAARQSEISARAAQVRDRLIKEGLEAEVIETEATTGGGSLPGQTLPSAAVSLGLVTTEGPGIDHLAMVLRLGTPGLFGRIEARRLLLDLRTVLPEDDERLGEAVTRGIYAARRADRTVTSAGRGAPAD